MDLKELDGKRAMHVDTSCKLYERRDTGIAFKITNTNEHKGMALGVKLKRDLRNKLFAKTNWAKIYAICIYYLIKDNLKLFDILVICGDEKFTEVKNYLNLLLKGNIDFLKKEVLSIYGLRTITGNKKIKSYAHGIAGAYQRRALRCTSRRQEGIELNIMNINFKMIQEKWIEI